MWIADKLAYRNQENFVRAYQGNTLVWERANNIIYYKSLNGQVVKPWRDGRAGTTDDYTAGFGAKIVSNTYANGVGKIVFDGPVDKVYFGFTNTTNLVTLDLPPTVTMIGASAFDNCDDLVSITIPEGVTSLGMYAFNSCNSLTYVSVPSTVTSIGDYAFRNTNNVQIYFQASTPATLDLNPFTITSQNHSRIYVPAESYNIYRVSTGWSNYASFIYGHIKYRATQRYLFDSDWDWDYNLWGENVNYSGSYFISDTGIGYFTGTGVPTKFTGGAFGGDDRGYLLSITIPSSIDFIGDYQFNGCYNLEEVIVKSSTPFMIGTYAFPSNTLKIYVPSGSVQAYKTASGWSTYASRIVSQ